MTALSFLLCASWASLTFRAVLVTIKLITAPSAAELRAILAASEGAGCSLGCQNKSLSKVGQQTVPGLEKHLCSKTANLLVLLEISFFKCLSWERILQTCMETLSPWSLNPLAELYRKNVLNKENPKGLFKSPKNAWGRNPFERVLLHLCCPHFCNVQLFLSLKDMS